MTRRKAIETAVAKAWELDNEPSHSHEAAAIAYDLGRIAGLREAVKFNDDSLSSAVKLRTLIRRLSRRLKP